VSLRTSMPGAAMLGILAAVSVGLTLPTASSPSQTGPSATSTTVSGIAPASWDVPLDVPTEPADGAPAAEELSGLLYSLADPGVSALAKGGLVEGGIGAGQAVFVDRAFNNANRDGYLPLNFTVSTGPGLASAAVTITGPKTKAYNTRINFVNLDGWKISKASALALMNAASGKA
jgi:hypothetical protein